MIDVETGCTVTGHKSSEGDGRTAADIERELSREQPVSDETEDPEPSEQETD